LSAWQQICQTAGDDQPRDPTNDANIAWPAGREQVDVGTLTFLAHFGAILFHTLIVRDGIWKRMAPWNIRSRDAGSMAEERSETRGSYARVLPG
jgi:hypothetical protein